MNNTLEHNQLMDDILFKVGSLPNVRLWPRVVGTARSFGSGNVIKFGIDGESDLDGIIGPMGKKLSIEVKTGRGKLSKAQQTYKNMILKFGGVYIEARSVEQVLTELSPYI